MNDAIIVALIGAGATLIVGIVTFVGVVITNKNANEKMNVEVQNQLKTAQAVTNTKIEELTREVREHNNFAKRMPVVENEIKHLTKEIKHVEEDIHKYHG